MNDDLFKAFETADQDNSASLFDNVQDHPLSKEALKRIKQKTFMLNVKRQRKRSLSKRMLVYAAIITAFAVVALTLPAVFKYDKPDVDFPPPTKPSNSASSSDSTKTTSTNDHTISSTYTATVTTTLKTENTFTQTATAPTTTKEDLTQSITIPQTISPTQPTQTSFPSATQSTQPTQITQIPTTPPATTQPTRPTQIPTQPTAPPATTEPTQPTQIPTLPTAPPATTQPTQVTTQLTEPIFMDSTTEPKEPTWTYANTTTTEVMTQATSVTTETYIDSTEPTTLPPQATQAPASASTFSPDNVYVILRENDDAYPEYDFDDNFYTLSQPTNEGKPSPTKKLSIADKKYVLNYVETKTIAYSDKLYDMYDEDVNGIIAMFPRGEEAATFLSIRGDIIRLNNEKITLAEQAVAICSEFLKDFVDDISKYDTVIKDTANETFYIRYSYRVCNIETDDYIDIKISSDGFLKLLTFRSTGLFDSFDLDKQQIEQYDKLVEDEVKKICSKHSDNYKGVDYSKILIIENGYLCILYDVEPRIDNNFYSKVFNIIIPICEADI